MGGHRHGQLVPSLLHLQVLQVLLSLPLLPLLPFHVLLLKEQLLTRSVCHVDHPVLTLKLKGGGTEVKVRKGQRLCGQMLYHSRFLTGHLHTHLLRMWNYVLCAVILRQRTEIVR